MNSDDGQTEQPAELAQQGPKSVMIGPATMERIAGMIVNDPNLITVITGVIEAAGGDPRKTWKLHLKGGLSLENE